MASLALGFIGILVLEADVVIGSIAPAIVGILGGAVIGSLWFALPLLRRDEEDAQR